MTTCIFAGIASFVAIAALGIIMGIVGGVIVIAYLERQ